MAAPTFVSQTPFASGAAGITVAACANVVASDIIFLFVETASENVATPSGFNYYNSTQVGTAGAAGATALWVFYQIASGADSTTTLADSGNHTAAVKVAYRNVYWITPVAADVQSAWPTAASVLTSGSAIAPRPNSRVIFVVALDRDASSTTPVSSSSGGANLTGWALRFQEITNAGAGGGLAFGDGVLASAGSTGAPSITLGTASIAVGWLIVLNEAPPPSSNTASINKAEPSVKDSVAATANVTAATELNNNTLNLFHSASSGLAYDIQGFPIPSILGSGSGTSFIVDVFLPYAATGAGSSNITLALTAIARYRKVGDTEWLDIGASQAQTQPCITSSGAYTQYGKVEFQRTLTGLLANTDYEFVIFTKFVSTYTSVYAQWDTAKAAASGFGNGSVKVSRPLTATVTATESGSDSMAASASVTGTGSGDPTGYIDAQESGSDSIAVSIEPRVFSVATISATDGADTAVIIANEKYIRYYPLHEVDVYGAGTSEQSMALLTINTLDNTCIRFTQDHQSLLGYPGPGTTPIYTKAWVGWKYRKVGDPTWIVMPINLFGPQIESNTTLGAWFDAENLYALTTSGIGSAPTAVVAGLLKNTTYEVVPTLRFNTDEYPLPPAGSKLWMDPALIPFNPDLYCWIKAQRLNGSNISAVEVGQDTLSADVYNSVVSIASINAAESATKDGLAAAANNVAQATLSASEAGADAAVIPASNLIQAGLSAQELGSDTILANVFSQTTATVSVATAEVGADTAVVSAALAGSASLAGLEVGADSAILSAATVVTAQLVAAELAQDTATCFAVAPSQAAASVVELSGDAAVASAKVIVNAAVSALEVTQDAGSANAAGLASVIVIALETGADTASVLGQSIAQASVMGAEAGADTASVTASVIPVTAATVSAPESGEDTVSATIDVITQAGIVATEPYQDSMTARGNVVASAMAVAIEAGQDSAAVMARVIIQSVLSAAEVGNDGFDGQVDTVPYAMAYLYALESGKDALTFYANVLDVDLHVQIANCRKTIFSSPDARVTVSSGRQSIQIEAKNSPAISVHRGHAVTAIDDDCG